MSVRRARERDLDAIHRLLEQLIRADADHRRAIWSEALRHEGYAAWVAEVGREPVGFIDLFVFPDPAHGRNIGVISNLIVDEHFRGRGVGESLLREAIGHCNQRHAAEVHVWTDFDNTPAIGAYKKLGFVERALLLELQLRRARPGIHGRQVEDS